MKAQVAELEQSLQDIPDPVQVLAEAETARKAIEESAANLLDQCLKTLNS